MISARVGVTSWHRLAIGLATAAVGAHCGSAPSVTQPSPGQTRALEVTAIPPPAALPALIGQWRGSSTVESSFGPFPECIAPFWRAGFTDRVDAVVRPFDAGPLDMVLDQGSGESCHLQAGGSDAAISAGPWQYDEFDCALVPALCGLSCHFQLKSSEWGCAGAPPDVWILGIRLTGAFAGGDANRVEGTFETAYAHRPAGSRGGYTTATVVKRFEISRIGR